MIYIDRISKEEAEEALKTAYEILPVDEFWEVRGLVIDNKDICWATKDKSCYYVYQTELENFVYFALEKKIQNIRGLYEVVLDLVYSGFPYIHFNGTKGRYDILKKAFPHIYEDNRFEKQDDKDFLVMYAAHPENVVRLINKVNRGNK